MHHRTFITCSVLILFYLYIILYIAVYKTYVRVMDSLHHISYFFNFFITIQLHRLIILIVDRSYRIL